MKNRKHGCCQPYNKCSCKEKSCWGGKKSCNKCTRHCHCTPEYSSESTPDCGYDCNLSCASEEIHCCNSCGCGKDKCHSACTPECTPECGYDCNLSCDSEERHGCNSCGCKKCKCHSACTPECPPVCTPECGHDCNLSCASEEIDCCEYSEYRPHKKCRCHTVCTPECPPRCTPECEYDCDFSSVSEDMSSSDDNFSFSSYERSCDEPECGRSKSDCNFISHRCCDSCGECFIGGIEEGYCEGYEEGLKKKCKNQYKCGYDAGYKEGYDAGYEKAKQEVQAYVDKVRKCRKNKCCCRF